MLLGDFGEADDVDEADDDGGDEDGEEGDDGDDDDEDSPDEDEIERFCQSIEIVDENDEVDGEDSVVEYVPDVVELLAPVVAVPAPKHANPEPLAPNPRPFAKRKCWTFGQKVSAIQKMERLSLTLCQAEKDLCIPFSNLQNWKKNKAKIFKEFYKATAQGWRDQTRQRGLCKWKEIGEAAYEFLLEQRDEQSLVVDKNDIISFCESKSEVFDSVGESSKNEFFKKWRRHYYITYRTVSGTTQFLPTDWEKQIDEYYGKLLSSNIQGCEFAIHWDETFVPFECIGKKTLERSGVHKVPVKTTGQEKEGCTVLLGGMYKKSTGQSYKLPPFFIFKLETSGTKVQPVIERKAEALGAYATTTDSGWMKDEKFLW